MRRVSPAATAATAAPPRRGLAPLAAAPTALSATTLDGGAAPTALSAITVDGDTAPTALSATTVDGDTAPAALSTTAHPAVAGLSVAALLPPAVLGQGPSVLQGSGALNSR